MINIEIVITILVFIGLVLFFTGILSLYRLRQERTKIISRIKGTEKSRLMKHVDYHVSGKRNLRETFLDAVISLGSFMKPKNEEELSIIRKKLLQAGYRKHHGPYIYIGFKVFFAILFVVIFSLGKLFIIKSVPNNYFMGLSILCGLTGFYLPTVWLRVKTDRRRNTLFEGFPDALDMMVVCVEAGMGPDAAIYRVGEEMKLRNKELSEEFKLLSLELKAGKPRHVALQNLAMRTGLEEVKSLMTLLIQTERFGTSVGQALRVHSDAMRTKRRQKAEEIAAKIPVKIVIPLILFILPSLFVVVVGPAIIKIYRVLYPHLPGGN